jgi:nucleoid-associated protein YgaU
VLIPIRISFAGNIMQRRQKIIVAAAVLVVGAALALEFRKGRTSNELLSPAAPGHNDASNFSPNGSDANQQAATHQQTTFDGKIESSPGEQSGGARQPVDSARAGDGGSGGVAGSTPPMVDLNAPDETHKIVDGDTLQKLAQRYLGSADHYVDLYQYNRDVLKNPEVLPIGIDLRIPPKFMLPPAGGSDGSALPAAQQNMAPASPNGTQLTSTPAVPPLTAISKNSPVSPAAVQHPKPRTYTVQFGDNLVDIARKLYGDGRRYQDLFDANRRQLRTPSDIKPGMVLAVP